MRDVVVHRFGIETGPDLVLLHGLTDAGTTWPDAVARWRGSRRIHALDLRGHGRSPRFTDSELACIFETLVSDLVGVLEALPGPAVVVGHSLGGRVGVAAALRRPDLVRGLVLEDPALDGDGPVGRGEAAARRAAFVGEQERFLDTFADGIAPEVARMRSETAWSEVEILEWAACKPLVDRRLIARLDLGDLDRSTALNALQVPTLLLADADGPLAPVPGEIRNAAVGLEAVPGVGHCIRRDDPDAYHALVDPFVAAV